MTEPKRIQMRRAKGWRKPEGAVYVGRPSPWGNPFSTNGDWIVWMAVGLGLKAHKAGRRQAAVALHRAWLTGEAIGRESREDGGALVFGDRTTVSLHDHACNIALGAASLYEQPAIPAARPDLTPLRGHDLACWCPLDQPCHADAILALANGAK